MMWLTCLVQSVELDTFESASGFALDNNKQKWTTTNPTKTKTRFNFKTQNVTIELICCS